jgi:hypothetical protein
MWPRWSCGGSVLLWELRRAWSLLVFFLLSIWFCWKSFYCVILTLFR